jgi:hypothetical protein
MCTPHCKHESSRYEDSKEKADGNLMKQLHIAQSSKYASPMTFVGQVKMETQITYHSTASPYRPAVHIAPVLVRSQDPNPIADSTANNENMHELMTAPHNVETTRVPPFRHSRRVQYSPSAMAQPQPHVVHQANAAVVFLQPMEPHTMHNRQERR